MKNYYELLQVNKNASKEIIKNAYKILSQESTLSPETKKNLEEAYNVLSNDFLREQYNKEYENEYNDVLRNDIYKSNQKNQINEKRKIKQNSEKIKNKKTKSNKLKNEKIKDNEVVTKENKKYRLGSMMSLVYIVKDIVSIIKNGKYKKDTTSWSKKDTIALISAIVIVIVIGIILWFIPFTHDWIKSFIFIW